jgi:hypothetical protein
VITLIEGPRTRSAGHGLLALSETSFHASDDRLPSDGFDTPVSAEKPQRGQPPQGSTAEQVAAVSTHGMLGEYRANNSTTSKRQEGSLALATDHADISRRATRA